MRSSLVWEGLLYFLLSAELVSFFFPLILSSHLSIYFDDGNKPQRRQQKSERLIKANGFSFTTWRRRRKGWGATHTNSQSESISSSIYLSLFAVAFVGCRRCRIKALLRLHSGRRRRRSDSEIRHCVTHEDATPHCRITWEEEENVVAKERERKTEKEFVYILIPFPRAKMLCGKQHYPR